MTNAGGHDIEQTRERIRAVGLRSTAPRIAVYHRLQQASGPVSHAELADDLAPLGFDKVTIYRNLVDLTEAGLVSRQDLGDHVWRFELINQTHDAEHAHPHFMCQTCGEVVCLTDVSISIQPSKTKDPFGSVQEVLLKGVCTRCE